MVIKTCLFCFFFLKYFIGVQEWCIMYRLTGQSTYRNQHSFAYMLIIFVHVIGSGLFTSGSYFVTYGWDYH